MSQKAGTVIIQETRTDAVDEMEGTSLTEALDNTPPDLREALEWFHERAGTEVPWPLPSPVSSLDHVVTQAKGIYKPSAHKYAVSVRQTLGSPYADRDIVTTASGGWIYGYHQEGSDPAKGDDEFTNVAFMANMDDRVPVAVLIQTRPKPKVRYQVLGLAIVTRWSDGLFYLEGFDRQDLVRGTGTIDEDLVLAAAAHQALEGDSEGEIGAHDARVKVVESVVRRSGQGAFRKKAARRLLRSMRHQRLRRRERPGRSPHRAVPR
jgi:hypothetical protein